MTERSKAPSAQAFAARWCERGRVLVGVVAGEALDRGEQVRRDALRHEAGGVVRLGVHRYRAAVGGHRYPRHRLDAAGEDEVVPAGSDLLGGHVDRLEARGAEAAERDPGDRVRESGEQGGGAGDDHALVTHRGHAPEDQVVDGGGIEAGVAPAHLVDEADDEGDGLHLVEGSAGPAIGGGLAAPARRPDRVVNQGVHRRILAHTTGQ